MTKTEKGVAAVILMWVLLFVGFMMITWGSLISHKVAAAGIVVVMSSFVWPMLQEFNLVS